MAEHKLSYTASEIDNRLRRVDDIPVVDSELSTTSTNPVQNKVITSKINSIESSLNQKANTSAIPTKTSQLTNNSGFLTSIPSEYVTETELTNKGYATQASVTALSNRIDNLPTGGNITVDSALSSTSTNPVQNKVIYEEFSKLEEALVKDFSDINDGFNEVFGEIEAINNEIDNLSASGGTGGGSPAIIDVVELPTENIDEDSFYRLVTGEFIINQEDSGGVFTCLCVNELPEIGGAFYNLTNDTALAYYNITDGSVSGYVTEDLSSVFELTVGWHTVDELLSFMSATYSGIIYNISDDPSDGAMRLFLEYKLYSYKGKWTEVGAGASSGENTTSCLPEVTTYDNGKVLMVVNGEWVAGTYLTDAEEVSF